MKPLFSEIEISPDGRPFISTENMVKRALRRIERDKQMSRTDISARLIHDSSVGKELWEILVPKSDVDGDISVAVHNIWDGVVRKITGGLTIHRSALGNWVSPAGELVVERMIPVRIACTEEQIHRIGQMTKDFYRQEKVMYYKVSDKVFIV